MKKFLTLVPVLLLIAFLFSASSVSASPPVPTVQMLSASYTNAALTGDDKPFTTVESIPFSVSAAAKMEVTSLNSTGSETCDIALDGTPVFNNVLNGISSITYTNQNISQGNHTLSIGCRLNCEACSTQGTQGSVSAILTTGV